MGILSETLSRTKQFISVGWFVSANWTGLNSTRKSVLKIAILKDNSDVKEEIDAFLSQLQTQDLKE